MDAVSLYLAVEVYPATVRKSWKEGRTEEQYRYTRSFTVVRRKRTDGGGRRKNEG